LKRGGSGGGIKKVVTPSKNRIDLLPGTSGNEIGQNPTEGTGIREPAKKLDLRGEKPGADYGEKKKAGLGGEDRMSRGSIAGNNTP